MTCWPGKKGPPKLPRLRRLWWGNCSNRPGRRARRRCISPCLLPSAEPIRAPAWPGRWPGRRESTWWTAKMPPAVSGCWWSMRYACGMRESRPLKLRQEWKPSGIGLSSTPALTPWNICITGGESATPPIKSEPWPRSSPSSGFPRRERWRCRPRPWECARAWTICASAWSSANLTRSIRCM